MTDSDRGLSRAQVEKQLDASLKRLRTDYVDLYQCHRYDAHAARGDDGGADSRHRKRQDARDRLFGMVRRSDPGGNRSRRIERHREVRVEPAAIFLAVARTRGRSDPAVRRQRHFADRVVAAWPGRAQRQIRPRQPAAARFPGGERGDGRVHGPADATRCAARGAALEADRRGGRADPAAVRARLGAARAQHRLGHHRRIAARSGARECRGLGRDRRYPAIPAGRSDHRRGNGPPTPDDHGLPRKRAPPPRSARAGRA